MKPKLKIMVYALSSVPLIMVLGNSMLIPEFPAIKKALEISQFQVGLLITIFSATAAVAIPFLGYLSDRWGRIKIIVPSLIIYGAGGIFSGVIAYLVEDPFKWILAGRVIQGFGAAGTAPIAMAFVGDVFQSEERSEVLGIIESANGLGKVISPILGSAIGLISWTALFFFYGILTIPAAIAVYITAHTIEEKPKPQKNYLKQLAKVFSEKGVKLVAVILAGMVVLFTLFGLLSYFSDLLVNNFKTDGLKKGLIIAIPILAMSITSFLNGRMLKKSNKHYRLVILIGLVLLPISLVLLSFTKNLAFYLLLFSFIGIGAGLTLPAVNTLVTGAASQKQRGIVTAIYGSSRFLGVALGPPTFSLLENISLKVMYLVIAGIATLVFVIGIFFIKEEGLKPASK